MPLVTYPDGNYIKSEVRFFHVLIKAEIHELVQLVATRTVTYTVDLILLSRKNVQMLYHLIHDRVIVNNF